MRLGGKRKPSMVCTPVICILRGQREEDCYKLEASLVTIVRSRLARARSQIRTKHKEIWHEEVSPGCSGLVGGKKPPAKECRNSQMQTDSLPCSLERAKHP